MSQKQTYDKLPLLAYVTACVTLTLSFCVWTAVLYSETYHLTQGRPALPPDMHAREMMVKIRRDMHLPTQYHAMNLGATVLPVTEKSRDDIIDDIVEEPSSPTNIRSHPDQPLKDSVEHHAAAPSVSATNTGVVVPEKRVAERTWELNKRYVLSIPKLGLRAPVYLPSMKYWQSSEWDLLEEQMQVGLSLGTVAYPHSVAAGSRGNVIIAGHSSPPNELARNSEYGAIFAKVPELEVGDTISVLRGRSYIDYRVTDKSVVSAKSTHILKSQYEESLLKLITCFPVGTTRDRMVVTAKLIESG